MNIRKPRFSAAVVLMLFASTGWWGMAQSPVAPARTLIDFDADGKSWIVLKSHDLAWRNVCLRAFAKY